MLLQWLSVFLDTPIAAITILPVILVTLGVALLMAITVHEFSHALVADHLGDLTPRRSGRLSLNPIRHLDPIGTMLFLLVGFGWGKPVPVNSLALSGDPWKSMAIVSIAGPFSNLIVAAIVGLPIRSGHISLRFSLDPDMLWGEPTLWLSTMASYIILYNIILSVFNMIPLAPLDGFKVFLGLAPGKLARYLATTEPYGPVALIIILVADRFFGFNILWSVFRPALQGLGTLLIGKPLA